MIDVGRSALPVDASSEMSALYSSCWSAAVAVALRVTGRRCAAEEIAQDVCTWVWRNPDRYEPARGSYRSLIAAMARNRALDWQRSESARGRREIAFSATPGAAGEPLMNLDGEDVFEAVMALPIELREPIHLAFWGGMTYRQVASHLGIPEGTAKSRLRTAQLRLRATLGGSRSAYDPTPSDVELSEARFAAGESRDDAGLRELFAAMPTRHRTPTGRRDSRCSFMDLDFVASSDRTEILTAALDAVLAVTDTRMGKVQLRDESTHLLRMEAHRGLDQPFVDYFASVQHGAATREYPFARGCRVIVHDVRQSRIFHSGSRAIVLNAGARSIQATPVIGPSGQFHGLLSTLHERPRRPEAVELRLLERVTQWMARVVEGPNPT